MFSLHTNFASNAARGALSRSSMALSNSMTRLSTGYRVNSAKDDAAGLQIATRYNAQSSGTRTALRSIQNGLSLLQTAEGVAEGIQNVFMRMKDLATQAADASYAGQDVAAMQTEFDALFKQHWTLLSTEYAGESLFVYSGTKGVKLFEPLSFQIGSAASETLKVNFSSSYNEALEVTGWGSSDLVDLLKHHAGEAIDILSRSIDSWSSVRTAFGSVSNHLEHASNNQAVLLQNTQAASGRIMEVDFAKESAEMTSQQLMQSSTAMLKHSSSTVSLITSLIRN